MTSTTTTPRLAVVPALLVAAILLLALNTRGSIVAVSPVTEAIRADLGIDGGTVGLLTSLPVLCFGLVTPAASALLARLGLGRGVLVALGVLLAGIVVRRSVARIRALTVSECPTHRVGMSDSPRSPVSRQ